MIKETKNEKYIINCPNCKSTFDTSEQMNNWKEEFFKEIEKIIKEMKKK